MIDINKEHYIDTVIYSIDKIIKGLKIELKNKHCDQSSFKEKS